MKLLITGGTGFIGSQLAREARARGHEIVVTGLLNSDTEQRRADRLEASGIHVVDGSLRVPSFARRLVHDRDAVIHLAAVRHAADVDDDYLHEVNVEATRILLEACVRAGTPRFLYGSAVDVYGAAKAAISEDALLAPDTAYGRSKAAAEAMVRAFSDRLATTVVRIGETYGPEDLQLLKFFEDAWRGLSILIGDGCNLHQPIHVQDVVRALLLAVEHLAAKNETFVIAGATTVTTREMLDTIAAVMGAPARRVRIPMSAVAAPTWITELLCRRLALQPPPHAQRLEFFRKSSSFSASKARHLLGFETSIAFAAGVRDTFKWYLDAGYLQHVRGTDGIELWDDGSLMRTK